MSTASCVRNVSCLGARTLPISSSRVLKFTDQVNLKMCPSGDRQKMTQETPVGYLEELEWTSEMDWNTKKLILANDVLNRSYQIFSKESANRYFNAEYEGILPKTNCTLVVKGSRITKAIFPHIASHLGLTTSTYCDLNTVEQSGNSKDASRLMVQIYEMYEMRFKTDPTYVLVGELMSNTEFSMKDRVIIGDACVMTNKAYEVTSSDGKFMIPNVGIIVNKCHAETLGHLSKLLKMWYELPHEY